MNKFDLIKELSKKKKPFRKGFTNNYRYYY